MEIFHENDNYQVSVFESPDEPIKSGGFEWEVWYEVVNRETGVTEYQTFQLPDAIGISEQLNMMLQLKPWVWDRAKMEQESMAEDGGLQG